MFRRTHPDSGFGEIRPHGYLLSGAHVRVPVPGERGLEFLELLRSEMCPLSSLSLRVLVVFDIGVFAVVDHHADTRVDAFRFYTGNADRVRSSCARMCRSILKIQFSAQKKINCPSRGEYFYFMKTRRFTQNNCPIFDGRGEINIFILLLKCYIMIIIFLKNSINFGLKFHMYE